MALLQLIDKTEYLIDKLAIPTLRRPCMRYWTLYETSAPGKVLITGGYLILFPKYRGISIALGNCQFDCVINVYNQPNTIHIVCPQWIQKELLYHYDMHQIKAHKNEIENIFIETALQCFIQYLSSTKYAFKLRYLFERFGLEIKLLGDESFYNNNDNNDNNNKIEIKMGLGSSAALTLSLIKSLFRFFNINDELNDLYNLSLLSHFISQQKIGSGFDIATSCFGSIIFERMIFNIDLDQLSTQNIQNTLRSMPIRKYIPIDIPPKVLLFMFVPNCCFGSKTPKMVKKLLFWKKHNETQCNMLWNKLNECNERIVNVFKTLENEYGNIGEIQYKHFIQRFVDGFNDNIICNELVILRSSLKQIREYQKRMSALSKVDIVPKIMDDVLNQITSIKCVIEGGLPGAGGYDAIYVLCVGEKQNVTNKLQSVCDKLNLRMLDV